MMMTMDDFHLKSVQKRDETRPPACELYHGATMLSVTRTDDFILTHVWILTQNTPCALDVDSLQVLSLRDK